MPRDRGRRHELDNAPIIMVIFCNDHHAYQAYPGQAQDRQQRRQYRHH